MEFFPPKTDEGDRNLLEKTIPALKEVKPDFCSVTYGAGGTTRDKTLMIVDSEEKIQAFLPELDQMMGGGLVTLEKIRVIDYRAGKTE